MNVQFKKGVLELCALVLINQKEQYGYELAQNISKKIQVADGSLYPLLRRLTIDGLVSTYLMESNEGPPRKYYKLSEYGKEYMNNLVEEWVLFSSSVDQLIEEAFAK